MAGTMVTHAEAADIAEPAKKNHRRLRNLLMLRPQTKSALFLGILSGAMYYVFYLYSGDIRQIAEMTNQGDKTYFLLPIGIAFLFSIVHGLFTDRFWEALGLKAKR